MRRLAAPLAYLLTAIAIILSTSARALINVGALDTPGVARDVDVVGGLAYVADRNSGLPLRSSRVGSCSREARRTCTSDSRQTPRRTSA